MTGYILCQTKRTEVPFYLENISTNIYSLEELCYFLYNNLYLVDETVIREDLLVLSGSVTIESNDAWGNRTILSHVGRGQFFAETYALFKDEPLLVDVRANEKSAVLFLRSGNIQALMDQSAPWANKYMTNILMISARKNLMLSGRSFHTAPKTIRGRVLSYLNSVSLQKHSNEFDIPFDRQQLADYLNLERSALSKELGKMQRDGLIKTKKNHFVILS